MTDSHFSAVLIWREGEDGREYLVIEYDSGEGTQIKFPGGTNTDHPGETPLETAHRECRDEVSLVMPKDPALMYSSRPKRSQDGNGMHLQHFFLIRFEDCAGNMRLEPKREGTDNLSPPFWRTQDELLIPPERGGLFFSHRDALIATEEFFNS